MALKRRFSALADYDICVRFFNDLGLEIHLAGRRDRRLPAARGLPRHSQARQRSVAAGGLCRREGAREVIWGVDSQSDPRRNRARYAPRPRRYRKDRRRHHPYRRRFGLAIGFRIFDRQRLFPEVELVNSPGRAERWNRHRKWYSRGPSAAHPSRRLWLHDLDKPTEFYRKRLKFRITDIARDRGVFLRAEGRNDHHNLFWAKTGKAQFCIFRSAWKISTNSWPAPTICNARLVEQARTWSSPYFVDPLFLYCVSCRWRSRIFRRYRLP